MLRFFAFTLVFLHHTMIASWGRVAALGEGSPPVLITALGFGSDLFFILTAYLITTLLLRERESSRHVEVGSFYLRRVLRIWPLYFLCIIVIAALEYSAPSRHMSSIHYSALLFFAGNWAFAFIPVDTIATPFWSISVSEQFYLVWPWIVARASRKTMFLCAAGATTLGILYRAVMIHQGVPWQIIHFSTIARLDALAVGVAIALWLRGSVPSLRPLTRGALAVASISLCILILEISDHFPAIRFQKAGSLYPLVVFCCAGFFVSVLGIGGARSNGVMRSKVVHYLGKVSFGMYMWHAIVISTLIRLGAVRWLDSSPVRQLHHGQFWVGLSAVLLFFAVTFIIASVSYFFFEMPFLKLKASLSPITAPLTLHRISMLQRLNVLQPKLSAQPDSAVS